MRPSDLRGWVPVAVAAVTATAFVACGGGGDQAGQESEGEQAAQQQQGPVVPPDSQAYVRGEVQFEGTVPEAEPVDMSQEQFCAAQYQDPEPRTQHVVVNDGMLQNAFVYVRSGLERSFPTPQQAATLDQEACRYRPHVMGMQVGQPLEIMNSDSVLHNINATPSANRGFNVSQPQAGMTTTRKFAVEEVMVPVACDVHGWMNAYIGVLPHPFYDVSGQNGSVAMDGLPPGEYVIEAWHERYGVMADTVTLAAGDTASVSFTYSADMAGAEVPLGDPIYPHDHADESHAAPADVEVGNR